MHSIPGINVKGTMRTYILIKKNYTLTELRNMICKFLYIKEEKRADIAFLE